MRFGRIVGIIGNPLPIDQSPVALIVNLYLVVLNILNEEFSIFG